MGRERTAQAAAVQRRPPTRKARSTPSNSDLKKFLKYTTAISQLCGQICGVSRVQKFSQNIVKFKYQLLCQFYCIPYSLSHSVKCLIINIFLKTLFLFFLLYHQRHKTSLHLVQNEMKTTMFSCLRSVSVQDLWKFVGDGSICR